MSSTDYDDLGFCARVLLDYVYKGNSKHLTTVPIDKSNVQLSDVVKDTDYIKRYPLPKLTIIGNDSDRALCTGRVGDMSALFAVSKIDDSDTTDMRSGSLVGATLSYVLSELVINNDTKNILLPIANIIAKSDNVPLKDLEKGTYMINVSENFTSKGDTRPLITVCDKFSVTDWKIIIVQVLSALVTIQSKHPNFRHNKLSLDNILVSFHDPKKMVYKIRDKMMVIDDVRFCAKISNFIHSNIEGIVDNKDTDKKKSSDFYDMHYFLNSVYMSKNLPDDITRFIQSVIPANFLHREKSSFSGLNEELFANESGVTTAPYIVLSKNNFFMEFIKDKMDISISSVSNTPTDLKKYSAGSVTDDKESVGRTFVKKNGKVFTTRRLQTNSDAYSDASDEEHMKNEIRKYHRSGNHIDDLVDEFGEDTEISTLERLIADDISDRYGASPKGSDKTPPEASPAEPAEPSSVSSDSLFMKNKAGTKDILGMNTLSSIPADLTEDNMANMQNFVSRINGDGDLIDFNSPRIQDMVSGMSGNDRRLADTLGMGQMGVNTPNMTNAMNSLTSEFNPVITDISAGSNIVNTVGNMTPVNSIQYSQSPISAQGFNSDQFNQLYAQNPQFQMQQQQGFNMPNLPPNMATVGSAAMGIPNLDALVQNTMMNAQNAQLQQAQMHMNQMGQTHMPVDMGMQPGMQLGMQPGMQIPQVGQMNPNIIYGGGKNKKKYTLSDTSERTESDKLFFLKNK